MPLYYFHFCDGEVLRDEEGTELPDAETATVRAFDFARELAAADVRDGHLEQGNCINIEGQDGEDVGTVTFEEAVTVTPRPPPNPA